MSALADAQSTYRTFVPKNVSMLAVQSIALLNGGVTAANQYQIPALLPQVRCEWWCCWFAHVPFSAFFLLPMQACAAR